MYLKRLELKGFKSFADKSVLTLEPGISAIVGPNGSGKSNICDAILWVLGERNAKSLRGSVMEDVIFAGSSERNAVSLAEVSVVLDNSDGVLPLDYNEVSLTRRLYRSGESEYLINNVTARRLDVLDILHDSGLGTDTNSIISQGNLDSILQSKPIDRRSLIEEAAGVLKHKQRKTRSENKIARMDQNMERIGDVMAEIERQLKPLRIKAKRAAAYDGLCDELSGLTLELAVDDLKQIKTKWDKTETKQKEIEAEVEKNRTNYDNAQKSLDEMRQNIAAQSSQIMDHSNRKQRLNSVIEKLNSYIMLVEEKSNNAKKVLEEYEKQINDKNISSEEKAMISEIDSVKNNITKLDKNIASLKADIDIATKELEKKKAEYQDSKQEYDSLVLASQNRQKESDDIQKSLNDAQDTIIEAQTKTQSVKSRIEDLKEKKQILSVQVKEQKSELEKMSVKLDGAVKDQTQISEKNQKLSDEIDNLRENKNRLTEEYIEVSSQIAASEKLISSLMEQESPATKWFEANKEEYGANNISDYIDVDDKYAAVIDLILGSDTSSYVFNGSLNTIKENLSMQEQNNGLLTLYSMSSNDYNNSILDIANKASSEFGATVLSSVVKTGAKHSVFWPLAGALYFENSDEAKAAFKKYPQLICSSSDGLVLFPDNKIVLANSINESSFSQDSKKSIVANKRILKKLQRQLKKIDKDINKTNTKISDIDDKLDVSRNESIEAQTKVATIAAQRDTLNRNFTHDNSALEKVLSQLSEAIEYSESLDKTYSSTAPEIDKLNKRLAELDRELTNDRKEITKRSEGVEALRAQYDNVKNEYSNLAKNMVVLKERLEAQNSLLQGAKSRLKKYRDKKTVSKKQLDAVKTVIARSECLTEVLSGLSDCAKSNLKELEKESNEATLAAKKIQDTLDESIEASNNARKDYEQSTNKLSEIKVELGKLDIQLQNSLDAIDSQDNISVESALEMPDIQDRQDKEQRVFKIRRRIANMGTINPDAKAEYDALKERFDYLNLQLDDLKNARLSLAKITKIIDERMKDDFINTFDAVNNNFQEIFEVLFPGGHAQLELDLPDDIQNSGVEVKAQPKGKRISKMSLMSGGEKSLVALCLLFAVYKTRSTPFYILDEVEAALDDTNLRRLIHYLADLCRETQLIMITHQRRTMEMADVLYGVSMKANGITKVVSQKLDKSASRDK